MAERTPDIVIVGAGIAGLWTLARLRALGYDALLLESEGIGGGQSIASQGIIHSGLKYALAGKINALAKSISAMPARWLDALQGRGPVNLSAARVAVNSQHLLIPAGFVSGVVNLVKAVDVPDSLIKSGFKGSVMALNEPVLDIPSVIRALAEPHKNCIRKSETDARAFLKQHSIAPQKIIFTAAGGNESPGIKMQRRPLLMGMMRPAPFALYAHLIGASDKPVATITTHTDQDGVLVWYIGGGAAERAKESGPEDTYAAIRKAFAKYLPQIDLSEMEWAALTIDRVEGAVTQPGWMPDAPTLVEQEDALYAWPTKLAFAPLLADMIVEKLENPSHQSTDWSFLPEAPYSEAPWNNACWIKDRSAKRA